MLVYDIINGGGNMKKIITLIIATLCLVLPFSVKAVDISEYNTLNLEQILTAEEIEPAFDEYKENDKQVIVYLFRGQGCGFCRGFLEYLNKIYEDEGDKFKVVSFETWNDSKNDELLHETAEFMEAPNLEKLGVPFIVIGDQYFPGFTEDAYGDAVLAAINEEYEKDPQDRYDVFEEMEKAPEKGTSSVGLGGIIIIDLIAVAIVVIYDTIRFNKLQDEIRQLASKKNK